MRGSLLRRFASITVSAQLIALAPVGAIPMALANGSNVPATGGSAISNTTVGGSWTSLTGPGITGIDTNDITGTGGTIIMNAPAGFEFDTGGTAPTVLVTCTAGCGGGAANNINNLATSSTIATVMTSSTVTITITDDVDGDSTVRNSLTWQNLRVRPTAVVPLASGNISRSSGGANVGISGIGAGDNFGTLTEIGVTMVTGATGGTAIGSATTGNVYTQLVGPVLSESDTGDIGDNGAGTIILNAPAGFEFDTGGVAPTVLVTRTSGAGADNRNINDQPSGTSMAISSITTSQITFTVANESSNGVTNSLTWQNIRIRPTATAPLATGTIKKTGASVITGVTDNSTSLGTLTEVDTTPPVISITGSNPATHTVGTAYVDAGATANDGVDGALAVGTASTVNANAVGSYTVTYTSTDVAGNTGSGTRVVNVVQAATTTSTVLDVPTPNSTVGDSVTFTATVSGGFSPTGTVEFKDNGVTIGTGALVAGVATFATNSLAVGSHPMTAHYVGDTNNAGSTSASTTVHVVDQDTTATSTVLDTPNPNSIVGDLVTFTATISGGFNVTGNVSFKDGGVTIGTGTVVAGTATFATSSLAVGNHLMTAVYVGDTNNVGSTSPSVSVHIVEKDSPTTVTNISSSDPAIVGENVTFTATVGGAFNPTGNVEFYEDATLLSTEVLNGSYQATYTTNALSVGAHNISAHYLGDTNNNASISAVEVVVVQDINKDSPDTVTTITSSGSAVIGTSLTFTATVSGAYNPTGNVDFYDGATFIGNGTLNGLFQATLTTSTLAVGSHNISAHYSGDGNNNASISAVEVVVVQEIKKDNPDTVTSITSTGSAVVGTTITFTATVAGAYNPTGNVEFYDGASLLTTVAVNGSFQASYATAALAVGSHNISAHYLGDSNNNASASNVEVVVVQEIKKDNPDTVTTLSSNNPAIVGENITFTATVAGAYNPTGTVDFYDGATFIGTDSLNGSFQADFTTNLLAVGSHNVTAHYQGDSNNNASASNVEIVVVQDVNKDSPDSVVTLSSLNPSVIGDSVTFTATVAGAFNPTGTVDFYSGSVLLGSDTLDGAFQATLTTSALPVGTFAISAHYLGDSNNNASISGVETAVVQTIDKHATTTLLYADKDTLEFGEAITLNATVQGFGSTTGTVEIVSSGGTIVTLDLTGTGTATISTVLPVGLYQVTATYSGDGNNYGSVSAPIFFEVFEPAGGGSHQKQFYSIIRFFTGNGGGGGFAPTGIAPGAYGGAGPNEDGSFSEEQTAQLCIVQERLFAMGRQFVIGFLSQVYARAFGVTADQIEAFLQDPGSCEQSAEEQALAAPRTEIAALIPVDSKGIPVSTDDVWNSCIRNVELWVPGESKPLNCGKYHQGTTWYHPDLNVRFEWSMRLAKVMDIGTW